VGGIFYVLEYNSFVSARYQVNSLKKQISDAITANTDLKNQLFKMTDPVELQTLAAKYNLTLERKPQYLNQNQWVSVSSYSQ
jgi:cell division protein FtsL